MVEKGIREGIYDATHQYAKANKKYIKYWDVNNLYGWAMSQKLPVNGFKQVEETSQFNEDFIKSYNKNMIKGFQYPEKMYELYNDLPFYQRDLKKKSKILLLVYMIKMNTHIKKL